MDSLGMFTNEMRATIGPGTVDLPVQDIEIISDLLQTNHGLIEFGIMAGLIGFYLFLRSRTK